MSGFIVDMWESIVRDRESRIVWSVYDPQLSHMRIGMNGEGRARPRNQEGKG